MESLGWRERRGSSPAARRGARQRAGLTPVSASNILSCERETHQTSSGRSNSLDVDHGIYRDPGFLPPSYVAGGDRCSPITCRPRCKKGRGKLILQRDATPFPCIPGRGSLLPVQRLGGMTDATAGVHRAWAIGEPWRVMLD